MMRRTIKELLVSDIDIELRKILEEEGYRDLKLIHGMVCGLQYFAFTVGMCIGLDDSGYEFRYCFRHLIDAQTALETFDFSDDPEGFIVRKGLGGDFHPGDQDGSLRQLLLGLQKMWDAEKDQ